MPKPRRPHAALLCALPAIALAACQTAPPSPQDNERTAAVAQPSVKAPARFERLLPFNDGPNSLTFIPRANEAPARGPNAVAVSPSGTVFVLDQLGKRIVSVSAEGEPQTVATVKEDAHDLVASKNGTFAAYSKVRSTAWFHGPRGEVLGQKDVPRSFMFIQRLSMDASGGLQVAGSVQ